MNEELEKSLQAYEARIQRGEINSFCIRIKDNFGIQVVCQIGDEESSESKHLDESLLQSLQTYFFNIESIAHDSPDYATLKSLLNAHNTLERIYNKAPQQDQQ